MKISYKTLIIGATALIVSLIAGIAIIAFYMRERGSRELGEIEISVVTWETSSISFQDPVFRKEIEIQNKRTGKKINIELESLEWNTYFYWDKNQNTLKIVDAYFGQSEYDMNTLNVLGENCMENSRPCGGYSDDALAQLGTPALVFSSEGFR